MLESVRRLTDPYANFLVPAPRQTPAVCPICRSTCDLRFPTCRSCSDAATALGSGTADLVVPLALAVKGQQLAHELWHYKNSPGSAVRHNLQRRLTALLWRFVETHEACISARLGMALELVTTVPSLSGRLDPHPLRQMVATRVRPTVTRHRDLLVSAGTTSERFFDARRFIGTAPVSNAVLVVDDTWASGSRAQSAAAALKAAGATAVAVVVIGRHIDPAYGSNQAFLKALQREQRFDWNRCCLESCVRQAQ